MRSVTLVLLGCLTLLSCDDDDDNKKTTSAQPSTRKASGSRSLSKFRRTIVSQTCQLLSAADIAREADLGPGQVRQRQTAGMCRYDFDGGSAFLGHLRLSESPEDAARDFASAFLQKRSASYRYEPVAGVGDQAVINPVGRDIRLDGGVTTVYDNQLHARAGDLKFSVMFAPTRTKLYKEELTRLARLVVRRVKARRAR